MADRTKIRYRGRTYTRKSLRPGKKTVPVKTYCRRPKPTFAQRYAAGEALPF